MIINELFRMALSAIWAHKLRSFLTLVGIIAGVSSIIGVMTGISVMQNTIEDELSVLGGTVFQVQKWLNGPSTRAERIKAAKRRPTTVEHANLIRENVSTVDLVGAELWSFGHTIKYRDKSTNPNMTICGGTPEYPVNNTHYIEYGRNISNEDVAVGRSVAVIGYQVARELFPWTDPLYKTIRIDGNKFTVIGVFEEKKSSFGSGFDNYVLFPITKFQKIYGMYDNRGEARSVNITVSAKSPELLYDAMEETRALMRKVRGLKPNEEDDFTIFTSESQIKQFNETTAGIKTGAFVIGIVALVVAGIGIMNIMLVSVSERTREIGVRKALGARRNSILLQFLFEAIILSNIGGVIGVVIGFGLGNLVSVFTGFALNVPMDWAVIGLSFCTAIGLIFGFWPAYKASKLIPVQSLRYE
ncbi:MAG: ABC transporter permease [Calditrichaeota bacterium]|nr:ABC transporter permease [Calditrichota bacterium]